MVLRLKVVGLRMQTEKTVLINFLFLKRGVLIEIIILVLYITNRRQTLYIGLLTLWVLKIINI